MYVKEGFGRGQVTGSRELSLTIPTQAWTLQCRLLGRRGQREHRQDAAAANANAAAANANVAAGNANAAGANASVAADAVHGTYQMGTVYGALPAGCISPNVSGGGTHYLCGNTWFSPSYGANGIMYRVVPTP